MTYRQAEEILRALRPRGMVFGLDRMVTALAALGNPHEKLRCVHIAGTNGKGSTAKMIQCMLTEAGFRCGLFHSPAPGPLRGCIDLGTGIIPEADFAALVCELKDANPADNPLTEFEALTLLALLHFSRVTDLAVIECGLGGQDDATNCIPPPLAAVITPVSMDHTAILGATVEEIAKNKCGIIKSPCAVVTSPEQDAGALGIIMEAAAEKGLCVHIPSPAASPPCASKPGETAFNYKNTRLHIPMPGAFQRANALTALLTVELLGEHGFTVTEKQMAAGLAKARLPLRQEILRLSPPVILDGAHNPHGAAVLADTLSALGFSGFTMITGMLSDKAVPECMALLLPFCREVLCCTPRNERGMPDTALAEIIRRISPDKHVSCCSTPEAAFSKWDGKSPLLAAGSFYVSSEIAEIIKNKGLPYK